MKLKIALMAVAALVMGGGTAQAANLIVNGDFTSPNEFGGWSQGAVPGWTNTNGDTLEVGASGIYGLSCATAGCQNLEVNANTFDTVSQTIGGLTIGSKYSLAWLYGGRPDGGVQTLNVSFGGTALTTDTGSYGQWTLNTFDIIATATSETLTFASVATDGLPSYGNEITAVSLTAVPEPAAWAMMLVGLGGMGAAMRMNRRGPVRSTAA